jgi:hypothetical protein
MKYFSNWNAMGKAKKREEGADKERFEELFGIKEADICRNKSWTRESYRKHFGKDLMFVHFNGDAKNLNYKCFGTGKSLGRDEEVGVFFVPELETVVNCVPDGGSLLARTTHPNACELPALQTYCAKMRALTMRRDAAMSAAWYSKYSFSHKRDNCGCPGDPCKHECPSDQTNDPDGEGAMAYKFRPPVWH